MKAFLLYFIIALIAISVQGALLFQVTRPDFVLILVIFYSLKHGQAKGVTYGALTGLLIDSANGLILGPNIMSKALIGYCIPYIKQKLFQWDIVVSTFIILIFSFLDMLLNQLCFTTFSGLPFINRPVKIAVLHVIVTTAAGIVLYFPFHPEKTS
jgi:rod shape-determining protein MreD